MERNLNAENKNGLILLIDIATKLSDFQNESCLLIS